MCSGPHSFARRTGCIPCWSTAIRSCPRSRCGTAFGFGLSAVSRCPGSSPFRTQTLATAWEEHPGQPSSPARQGSREPPCAFRTGCRRSLQPSLCVRGRWQAGLARLSRHTYLPPNRLLSSWPSAFWSSTDHPGRCCGMPRSSCVFSAHCSPSTASHSSSRVRPRPTSRRTTLRSTALIPRGTLCSSQGLRRSSSTSSAITDIRYGVICARCCSWSLSSSSVASSPSGFFAQSSGCRSRRKMPGCARHARGALFKERKDHEYRGQDWRLFGAGIEHGRRENPSAILFGCHRTGPGIKSSVVTSYHGRYGEGREHMEKLVRRQSWRGSC